MRVHHQLLRFASVGVVGTAVQYAILWLGVSLLQTSAGVASAIGYIFGAIANYLLNRLFTFKSAGSHSATAPRYLVILVIGWSLNTALMAWWVDGAGWNAWFAQVVTTAIGLAFNFSASRWWAFRSVSR
ncbi:GtrA family protein [Robbsia sp. Bb-Pol-6]|uniref:GtrA family protein n=1 Tax=Robbsia betulipollinis TaxID=2981849 RepID=A0ABT3ZID9_9BURK|nr:GtrA family protein [Robbsia betulipollinis]MCY0386286.1 GtrA family protein [Robbsia betulipollinis]